MKMALAMIIINLSWWSSPYHDHHPLIKKRNQQTQASHFFLPHGLKLRPALSRAIFAINSTFMIQFCLFPMKYHCEVQIAFSRKLKFQVSPENNTQQNSYFYYFHFSTGQRSFLAMKWESTWEWGWGQSGRATLKPILFAWFTASKKAIRHSAGLVLAAIIWPTRAWYRP